MTTKVFFHAAQGTTPYRYSSGTNDAPLAGGTSGWSVLSMTTAQGSAKISKSVQTVAGPTSGLEVQDTGTLPIVWVTAPLDADVTIAGTITLNLWAFEDNMSANAAVNCAIDRIDSVGAVVSRIATSARVTEVAVTTAAVNNFTVSPTSTACLKGDRLRFRVFADDAGTMGGPFNMSFDYGAGAAVDGDSYVTFTETFGFLTTDPTTTTVYPTNTASAIGDPDASFTERDMWTSRGGSAVASGPTNVTGWTAPVVGSFEWFTRPLVAFTLAGPVFVNMRVDDAVGPHHASPRLELAVTASDGTGATVWAATTHPTETGTTEAVRTLYLVGDDLAITDGQRLRLRYYIDDSSTTAMTSGGGTRLFWAGPTPGASGDTYLIFGQALTEYVAAGKAPPFGANRHLSLNHLIRR